MDRIASPFDRIYFVCRGEGPPPSPDCGGGNPLLVAEALKKALAEKGLAERHGVVLTGCLGLCEQGPNVAVFPGGAVYARVLPSDAAAIVAEQAPAPR